jgi:hypothetical protein
LSAAEKINDQCSVFGQSPSIKGKTWFAMQPDANRIERLVNGFGLPEIVARLIVLRDLDHNDADLDELLNPTWLIWILRRHFWHKLLLTKKRLEYWPILMLTAQQVVQSLAVF